MNQPVFLCTRAKDICLAISFLSIGFSLPAQTFIYSFSAPTNKFSAGNAGLSTGSVWLYSKIDAGATTDAVVTITNQTGGVSLTTFDQDNIANGGYTPAFQPTIAVNGTGGSGTVNGYVEFTFTFIATGTYNAATKTGTLLTQTINVPATVLDDDGTTTGGNLNEYDVLNLGTGEIPDYSSAGGDLTVTSSGNNITGTNTAGTNYPGISSTATAVMFTVINHNITSLVFRTGVISTFTAAPAGRVSSLAFFRPTYPASVLAVSPLSDFKGVEKDNSIALQWQLPDGNSQTETTIERSVDGGDFQPIKDLTTDPAGSTPHLYSYTDQSLPVANSIAYRLKITDVYQTPLYSNILLFNGANTHRASFNIYPTLIRGTATIVLSSETAGTGSFQIADYSGRIVYQQQVSFGQGDNVLNIPRPMGLPPGNFIALLRTRGRTDVQKIILGAQ